MRAENLGELQIWMEGQFSLVQQAQVTTAEDVRQIRSRVHDLGNEIAKLLALDIEGKFKQLELNDAKHDTAIQQFGKEAAERRGAIQVLKIIYTTGGAAAGAGLTLLFELAKVFHT